MACEACTVKFTLFKRKKQCMDCLHYFCAGCVIKRRDRVLSCDNCSMLSRRPLIKSQVIQMRTRHLRNYLEAKKVNIRGCLEKDDLVNLLILYVNETENSQRNTNHYDHPGYHPSYRCTRPPYFDSSTQESASVERDSNFDSRIPSVFDTVRDDSQQYRVSSPTIIQNDVSEPAVSSGEQAQVPQVQNEIRPGSISEIDVDQSPNVSNEQNNVTEQSGPSNSDPAPSRSLEEEGLAQVQEMVTEQSTNSEEMIIGEVDEQEEPESGPRNGAYQRVEIEEILESEYETVPGPEPVITESDETPVDTTIRESSETLTEIKTWPDNVKLSDIQLSSDLNQLTTKQLKYLLIVNRVDFKGCVERYELLDRVLRLWTEYQKSRTETENCDLDSSLCKICLDAPIECVILECGHMACCIDCGKKMAECPICRQYIVRVVRIFRS